MNLAIGALLVAILLLPGIIFRYLYIRSDALRKTIDLSLLNEVVFILTPSLLLHLAGQGISQGIMGRNLDLKTLYLLLTGNGEDLDFSLIEQGFPYFVFYILSLCVIAGFLGIWLQKMVVYFGWDERYKILRIYNDWDKYFSGAVLPRAERDKIDFVQVDVVVQSAQGDVLYTGVLENYTLNKDQGIDRLFLSNAYRRVFTDDLSGTEEEREDPPEGYPNFRVKDFDDRYYALPGAYFVIPFGEIRNLNISYNTLVEVEG